VFPHSVHLSHGTASKRGGFSLRHLAELSSCARGQALSRGRLSGRPRGRSRLRTHPEDSGLPSRLVTGLQVASAALACMFLGRAESTGGPGLLILARIWHGRPSAT